MKSDTDYDHEPRAMLEVRAWKAEVWEDVKDLPFENAVCIIARRAHETAVAFGFCTVDAPTYPACVAEKGEAYGAAKNIPACKGVSDVEGVLGNETND